MFIGPDPTLTYSFLALCKLANFSGHFVNKKVYFLLLTNSIIMATTTATKATTTSAVEFLTNLNDKVPIPPKDTMNTGLSVATQATMIQKLGLPGKLTQDCSSPTGAFKKRVKSSVNVGPFVVTGLDFAVESLMQIFSDVKEELPQIFRQVKTEGMLCVRARRHNPSKFSNHSWGTAIDLFFGKGVIPQGQKLAQRGMVLMYPFFNRHGWFWGAEFSGDSVDSMHFELAEETVLKFV